MVATLRHPQDLHTGPLAEGYVYDPGVYPPAVWRGRVTFYDGSWGNPSSTSSYANVVLYCGYRLDTESALYHVRRRDDHPTLGRWLQRDPLGYVDGMSLYEYCVSSPVAFVDWAGGAPAPTSGRAPATQPARTRAVATGPAATQPATLPKVGPRDAVLLEYRVSAKEALTRLNRFLAEKRRPAVEPKRGDIYQYRSGSYYGTWGYVTFAKYHVGEECGEVIQATTRIMRVHQGSAATMAAKQPAAGRVVSKTEYQGVIEGFVPSKLEQVAPGEPHDMHTLLRGGPDAVDTKFFITYCCGACTLEADKVTHEGGFKVYLETGRVANRQVWVRKAKQIAEAIRCRGPVHRVVISYSFHPGRAKPTFSIRKVKRPASKPASKES